VHDLAVGWSHAAGLAAGAAALGGACLLARRAAAPPPVRAIPVLRWRLVGPPRPGSPINELRVAPSRFEALVRHVARRGLQAVSLTEAVRRRGEARFLARDPVVLTFDGSFAAFEQAAYPALRRWGLLPATLFCPASYVGAAELTFPDGGRPEPLLSPDALRRLADGGVAIGLQVLGDDVTSPADRLLREKADLEERIGRPVEAVAFPATPRPGPVVTEAARAAGFAAGCLTGEGGVLTRRQDALAIPRFGVGPHTPLLQAALYLSRRRFP